MRTVLLVLGMAVFLFGALFTLQGLDIVHWPADSFMLGKQTWVMNGAIIMVVGVVLVVLSRRGLRR